MPYDEPEEYRPEPPLRPQITGPLAWEDASLPFSKRLISTLAASFAPLATLHAVSHGPLAPALSFALVTALPFMLAWGAIPLTQTLLFKPPLGLEVLATAHTVPVWLDVVRALALGCLFSLVSLIAWSLPFVSLVRAFVSGVHDEAPALSAWRTMLYRAWVIPAGASLFWLLYWLLPPNAGVMELAVLGLHWLPRVLVIIHCHAMARYFGAGGLGAFAVSIVPLALEFWASRTLERLTPLFLPSPIQG